MDAALAAQPVALVACMLAVSINKHITPVAEVCTSAVTAAAAAAAAAAAGHYRGLRRSQLLKG
jgi:hypothetical protein